MRSRTSERIGALAVAASLAYGVAAEAAATRGGDEATRLLRAAAVSRTPVEEGIITARIEAPEGRRSTSGDVDLYVKGRDRSLCVFRSGKQQGRRILSAEGKTWLLTPGSSRAIPVSSHQRLGRTAFNELLRLDLAAQFDAVLRPGDEDVEGVRCRALDLKAIDATAPYAGGTLWIDRADRARRLRLTLPSGKEALEIRFADQPAAGGGAVLSHFEVYDLLGAPGAPPTRITILRSEAKHLEPAIFTPAGARALP
jgi:hypothetical protein